MHSPFFYLVRSCEVVIIKPTSHRHQPRPHSRYAGDVISIVNTLDLDLPHL